LKVLLKVPFEVLFEVLLAAPGQGFISTKCGRQRDQLG